MKILEKLVAAVLLHFFFFTAPSMAHIISPKLQSDTRQMIPLSHFEFTNAGHVSFVLPSVTLTATSSSSPPDLSRIGFFLHSLNENFFLYSREKRNQEIFEFQQNTTICPLEDVKLNSSQVLFTFQNLSHAPHFSFNKSFNVTNSGMNSLFFINCNNKSQTVVTIKGHIELYNIDGATKNYLSAGLTQLPTLSFIYSFIYLTFLGFWILVCLNNRRVVNTTHLLMGGLLVLTCVHFICDQVDLHYLKVTGTARGFDILSYLFQLIRAELSAIVIVLITGGCFFLKPVLKRKDKFVLLIVILLEIWANVDPLFPWEVVAPYNLQDLSLGDPDVLCCIVIFVHVALSMKSLYGKRVNDLNARRYLRKLWLFMVLAITYVNTRFFLLALPTPWLKYVVNEVSVLSLSVFLFHTFRPADSSRVKNDVMIGLSTSKSISCFYSPV